MIARNLIATASTKNRMVIKMVKKPVRPPDTPERYSITPIKAIRMRKRPV